MLLHSAPSRTGGPPKWVRSLMACQPGAGMLVALAGSRGAGTAPASRGFFCREHVSGGGITACRRPVDFRLIPRRGFQRRSRRRHHDARLLTDLRPRRVATVYATRADPGTLSRVPLALLDLVSYLSCAANPLPGGGFHCPDASALSCTYQRLQWGREAASAAEPDRGWRWSADRRLPGSCWLFMSVPDFRVRPRMLPLIEAGDELATAMLP